MLHSENKVIYAAAIGMFLSTLDTSIMSIAQPHLCKFFDTTIAATGWTVSIYMIMLCASIILIGRIGDQCGRIRVYQLALVGFFISSVMCALANSIEALILFRGLQGVAAAGLQAISASLITTLLPTERQPRGMALLTISIGLGPVLGPVIAGIILEFFNWPWLFWINVPLILISMPLTRGLSNVCNTQNKPLFLFPILLVSATLIASQMELTHVISHQSINSSRVLLISTLLSLLSVKKYRTQLMEVFSLHYISSLTGFSFFLVTTTAFGICVAIVFIFTSFYTQNTLNLSQMNSSLIFMLCPIGLIAGASNAKKRMMECSPLIPLVTGLTIMGGSLLALALTYQLHSVISLSILLSFFGFGCGVFQPANMKLVLTSVDKQFQSTINGLNRMVQNFALAIGTTLSTVLISTSSNMTGSHTTAYSTILALGCCAISFSLVFFIGVLRSNRKKLYQQ